MCRSKRIGASTTDAPAAVAPNVVWAVDFQFDADEYGREIETLSIVDEHTLECTGGLVDRSITADRVAAQLNDLVAVRDAPAVLRSDNGPEFISVAMSDWAVSRTGLSCILPGSPWSNGYVESSNRRLHDECLNIKSFYSLLRPGAWSATGKPSTTIIVRTPLQQCTHQENRRLTQRPDLAPGGGPPPLLPVTDGALRTACARGVSGGRGWQAAGH